MKFDDIESAKKYLNDIENNLKQYEDQEYNLNQDILKTKEEIGVLKNLQDELRQSNYNFWCQQTIQEKQVEDIKESEPTLDDIIKSLD